MKRSSRTGTLILRVLVLSSLLAAGCSWNTTFVVRNDTKGPISVTYTLVGCGSTFPRCPEAGDDRKPYIKPVEELDDFTSPKTTDKPATFEYDSKTHTVRVSVPSGHAVSLFNINGYHGFESEEEYKNNQYEHLKAPLSSLTISSDAGALSISGAQILRAFEKEDMSLYILRYE